MKTLKRDRSAGSRGTWWTLARRRWAYGVLVALGGAAVVYGIQTAEQTAALLAVGAALLGTTGLAVTHPTED